MEVVDVVDLFTLGATVDVRDSGGRTPLHYAAKHGHELCVRELVTLGAIIDPKTNISRTPLHYAAVNGHVG